MPQDELELVAGGHEEMKDPDREAIFLVRRQLDRIADRMRAEGLANCQMYASLRTCSAWLTHVGGCDDCVNVYWRS